MTVKYECRKIMKIILSYICMNEWLKNLKKIFIKKEGD